MRVASRQVIKRRVIFRNRMPISCDVATRISCRCVSSPQSNMKTSLWHRTASAAVCAVGVPATLDVPSTQAGSVVSRDCTRLACTTCTDG